jgi:hypothetical protein
MRFRHLSAQPLDISRPRDIGGLISTTFDVYRRHFGLFATLALGTVLVVEGIVYGVGGGWLWSSYDADYPLALDLIDIVLPVLVLTPLITATHIQAVSRIAAGRLPPLSEALQAGLAVFAAALAVCLLVTLGVLLGLVFLIVPGVYAGVSWFVAVQAAVVEGKRGTAALGRSHSLVQGNWWRVFGIGIVVCGLPVIAIGIVSFGFAELAQAADAMALYLVGRILFDAIFYSFTALASTLLYFDLRSARA